MAQMPTTRAQLAYDIVGSSAQDDDLLSSVRSSSEQLLRSSFGSAQLDFDARTNVSATGDGDLMSFPETFLPGIIDMTQCLHNLLLRHNRTNKPEIPMRVAVHTGPLLVTSEPSFQRNYIELARMLEAETFKQVVRRCQKAGPYSVALILSDQAYRTAVRARHTTFLVPHQFAAVLIRGKSYEDRCWIHVPSVDAARVAEYAGQPGGTENTEKTADSDEKQEGPGRLAGANVIGNAVGGDNNRTMIANFGSWRGQPQ